MKQTFPEVLTIHQAAAYLQVSAHSLYKLSQKGLLPCQKVGKHWRFSKSALDEWLRNKVKADDIE